MSIVLAYARRPECDRALEWSVGEARMRELPLDVVYVQKVGAGQESGDRIVEHRAHLEELQDRLIAEGLRADTRVIYSSDRTSDVVLREVESTGAELLVIGMRGRSAVGKLLMGSVAQELLLGAACPVVAIKASGTRS